MFTLIELRLLQELAKKSAVPFEIAHVAASINQKLIEGIADLEEREARAKAASQLRATRPDVSPATAVEG